MLPWFSRTNDSPNDSVQLESMVETINRLGMYWIALTADREAIVMRIWRCYIRRACFSHLLSIISCMAEGTHRPMPQRYLQSRDSDGWWRFYNLCDDRVWQITPIWMRMEASVLWYGKKGKYCRGSHEEDKLLSRSVEQGRIFQCFGLCSCRQIHY